MTAALRVASQSSSRCAWLYSSCGMATTRPRYCSIHESHEAACAYHVCHRQHSSVVCRMMTSCSSQVGSNVGVSAMFTYVTRTRSGAA